MRVTVYTPTTLNISDRHISDLTERARRRRKIPAGRRVPTRLIIEEARRAGLIELGSNYVVDPDEARTNGTRRRAGKGGQRRQSTRATHGG